MALPLEGIRVIDLTVWFQGPVAAQHLADFGAEVIHVERPQGGDFGRGVRTIKAVPVGDWNQYFLVINRNKKSIALDLKQEAGQAVMRRLVEQSDVFLSNLADDNLERWGLTYEKLSVVNPRLVYAIASGYGRLGGMTKPSFDMTVQALTGLMARQGEPGQPPIYLGMGSGDAIGGLFTALGVMLALHQRRKTRRGQEINASLYGAQLFMAAPTLQPYLATGDDAYAKQQSRMSAPNPLWNTYQASDRWVFLCLGNTDENWMKLAGTLDDAELRRDHRFSVAENRRLNNEALIAALNKIIATRPASEWIDRWSPVGITASPIDTLADLAGDPQAWENDYLVKTHCEDVQREVTVRGLPIGLSKTPGTVRTLGPELGQHTEEILVDTLGYSWEDIGELKEQGVIL